MGHMALSWKSHLSQNFLFKVIRVLRRNDNSHVELRGAKVRIMSKDLSILHCHVFLSNVENEATLESRRTEVVFGLPS